MAENIAATSRPSAGLGARFGAAARRAPLLSAVAGMALVGVAISIYLTAEHFAGAEKRGFCPLSGGLINCGNVLTSKYSVVPGTQLPVSIPGILWFLVSGGLALAALWYAARGRAEPDRLRPALLAWGAVGVATILYLVYCEFALIHYVCLWCTAVHILTLVTFFAALRAWQVGPAEEPVRAAPQRAAGLHPPAHPRAPQRAVTSRAASQMHRASARTRASHR
jgi:uncharacterized membrane protein